MSAHDSMMKVMMRPRTLVLIGALSLAAGWTAGTTSSPATQDAAAERRTGPRPLDVEPAKGGPYTEQLRQKLKEHPRSPIPGRNPFVFGSRHAPPALVRRAEMSAAAPEPDAGPALAASPFAMFRLSGVASTRKDGAVVLTAILIDNETMVLVKAGDRLSGGHSVLRIEEQAVVIADAAGVEQVIRLP